MGQNLGCAGALKQDTGKMDMSEKPAIGSEKRAILVDAFNREINYLRISITDRCNLRCIYCMPPFGERKLRHRDILRYEELLRIARIAIKLGVTKIRLTGGEPLIRNGVQEFIPMRRLKIPYIIRA